MLNEILPDYILKPLSLLDYDYLCEIRLRIARPIMVNYKHTYYYLGHSGLCNEANAIVYTKDAIQNVVARHNVIDKPKPKETPAEVKTKVEVKDTFDCTFTIKGATIEQ